MVNKREKKGENRETASLSMDEARDDVNVLRYVWIWDSCRKIRMRGGCFSRGPTTIVKKIG